MGRDCDTGVSPSPATFIPERLDGPEPRFVSYCDGAKLPVLFRRKDDGTMELIYERYKFRRTGALN